MSKFIPVGKGELINTNIIARIIPTENLDGCVIITHDGQHYHSEYELLDQVDTYDRARAVFPCPGVSAIYLNGDGTTEIRPCAFVILKDDGTVDHINFVTDEDIELYASNGTYGFLGFVPSKEV